MPTPSRKPTLLIINSETSEAERIVSTLRDDGLAERSVSIPNGERLETVFTDRGCDLVICCGYDKDVDLDEVLAAYRRVTLDMPLILISDPEHWASDTQKARHAGIRGLTRRNDSEHLKMLVAREFADLLKRREASGLISRLQNCEQSTLSLIEVTRAGVAFVQDGLHIEANAAYVDLFGYQTTDDLLAIPFLDLIAPTEHKQIRDLLKSAEKAALTESTTLDVTCTRADSSEFAARILAAAAEIEDEPCLRIILQPVQTAPSASGAAAGAGASTTHEVGLSQLLEEIEDRVGEDRVVLRPFAIFFLRIAKSLDLSRDMGFTVARGLFEELGQRILTIVGERGSVRRVSDDAFVIVVEGLGEFDAKALAEQIKEEARLDVRATGHDSTTPDCDIGYFIVQDRASAAEDILNAAHRLCIGHELTDHDHKAGQQAPTSLAARSKQEVEDDDVAIARKIEYALRNNQLKLVYQPIISLMGDNQENYSVLLRLLDEEENLLEAKDFIGPAIRSGLIEEVDKWTIRAAIQVIGEQRRAGHNLSLFINLSEDTFRNPSIVLWICDCLREFDVRGNWLTFQFQEELVVGNLASIGKLVETLKKIKCRVAVNRFGVSDRPEMLLQGLSLDFVLLKPSFSQGLADDTNKQQRLLQLATLAREFNVKSIVTGVEDARALTVLWTAGVDYVQGNFLQRPSPTLEVQA
ncbi:EAL domain-containing protein [Thiocystis violacea]|uniref:EAL domain-containing protein n=1 Tax=Thiocystis violacea TaxID=13725 RepID=UPI0019056D78|nr:bifunctional diguanylate cyclase/phosphodiesterase [Thiocystis violacea]MBK1721991.1 diguanylate phosphodiesterase [Thiocystis violacea]